MKVALCVLALFAVAAFAAEKKAETQQAPAATEGQQLWWPGRWFGNAFSYGNPYGYNNYNPYNNYNNYGYNPFNSWTHNNWGWGRKLQGEQQAETAQSPQLFGFGQNWGWPRWGGNNYGYNNYGYGGFPSFGNWGSNTAVSNAFASSVFGGANANAVSIAGRKMLAEQTVQGPQAAEVAQGQQFLPGLLGWALGWNNPYNNYNNYGYNRNYNPFNNWNNWGYNNYGRNNWDDDRNGWNNNNRRW